MNSGIVVILGILAIETETAMVLTNGRHRAGVVESPRGTSRVNREIRLQGKEWLKVHILLVGGALLKRGGYRPQRIPIGWAPRACRESRKLLFSRHLCRCSKRQVVWEKVSDQLSGEKQSIKCLKEEYRLEIANLFCQSTCEEVGGGRIDGKVAHRNQATNTFGKGPHKRAAKLLPLFLARLFAWSFTASRRMSPSIRKYLCRFPQL